jgi:DNA-binding CsgD family transcriptional regulator
MRASRVLALAARAGADLADAEPETNREALVIELRDRAAATACFAQPAARVLGAAYGATFEAEIARLQRSGEEPAWRATRDTWASHDVPHHTAYAGWRLAVCLLDRARRNDGQDELVTAYAAAVHHEPLRREIEALAGRARLPLEATPQQPAATAASGAAPSGLTPRELDVLRLLGTGASNDQIAHQLYISPKTASFHVTHIFRKLGVTGRVQAAMVAERMGLLTTGGNDRRTP